MPYLPSKAQQKAKRLANKQLDAQAAYLEERYQNLAHQFRTAQVQFRAVHKQYRAVRQECEWLQRVVYVKQQAIEELLPYYPHPLTPQLINAIELY